MAQEEKQQASNPYPKWQGDPPNCWVCYRLLWTGDEFKAHLCAKHQQRYVAAH